MTISRFSAAALVALVPQGYTALTRLRTVRDWAYWLATAIVPALYLVVRLRNGFDPADVATFALSYLVFVCVYELGYFFNDRWDAMRHSDGRGRATFAAGPAYATVFVAVRVAMAAFVACRSGWLALPTFLVAYGLLAVSIVSHNLVRDSGIRLATFSQLAVLRFSVPLVPLLDRAGLVVAGAVALLLYLPLRLLAYADSKSVLLLPSRKAAWFGPAYLLASAPLVVAAAMTLDSDALVELWAYYVALYATWAVFGWDQRQKDN